MHPSKSAPEYLLLDFTFSVRVYSKGKQSLYKIRDVTVVSDSRYTCKLIDCLLHKTLNTFDQVAHLKISRALVKLR